MADVNTTVEFFQASQGSLFRIVRTPEHTLGHLLFISPLFEQANQTRHHITKSSIHAYHRGLETIIFDHYGTGDSEGELSEANLLMWQQDIVKQLLALRSSSLLPIYLSIPLSAALLLTDDIIKHVNGIMLLQPEFNGERYVKQFKRLAVAKALKNDIASALPTDNTLEIAGYSIKQQLLSDLAEQDLTKLKPINLTTYWFEWLTHPATLSTSRKKQQEAFIAKNSETSITTIDDGKFWQATELNISSTFLTQEKLVFLQLIAANKKRV